MSITPPAALPLYALFHVNGKTGAKVRYPAESFPAGTKDQIESFAQGSRIGQGLGSAYPGDWTTQSLPEDAVAAEETPELKDAPAVKPLSAEAIFEAANASLTTLLAGNPSPGWLPNGIDKGSEGASDSVHFTLYSYSQKIGLGETALLRLCATQAGEKLVIVSEVRNAEGIPRVSRGPVIEVDVSPERLMQLSRRMNNFIAGIETLASNYVDESLDAFTTRDPIAWDDKEDAQTYHAPGA